MKSTAEVWKPTTEQVESMILSSRLSSFLVLSPETEALTAVNALDESFTAMFIDTKFGKSVSTNKALFHNIPAVLKTVKSIGVGSAEFRISEGTFVVSDESSRVKCNFQFASPTILKTVLSMVEDEKYKGVVEFIVKNDEASSFSFPKSLFNDIKTFGAGDYNTIAFAKDKIVLYDNTGSTDFSQKPSVEIKLESDLFKEDKRFDLGAELFTLLPPADYKCTISPPGYLLFDDSFGKMFILASNINE